MNEQYISAVMPVKQPPNFTPPSALTGQQLRNIQAARKGDPEVRALLAEIKRLHIVLQYMDMDAKSLEIALLSNPQHEKGPLFRIQHALSIEPSVITHRAENEITSDNFSVGRSRTR